MAHEDLLFEPQSNILVMINIKQLHPHLLNFRIRVRFCAKKKETKKTPGKFVYRTRGPSHLITRLVVLPNLVDCQLPHPEEFPNF